MGKKLIIIFALTACLLTCLFFSSCAKEGAAVALTGSPSNTLTTPPDSAPPATPSAAPTATQAPAENTPAPTPAPTFSIDTDRQDAIYNQGSVSAVFLGMKKSELETSFIPGDVTKNKYTPYDDYGFFVKYYGNDTVKELVIFDGGSWETFSGISCGSTLSELIAAYGEPLSSKDGIYTYYTLKNELLKEAPSFIEVDINYLYTLSFIIEDGVVSCVMLSRF